MLSCYLILLSFIDCVKVRVSVMITSNWRVNEEADAPLLKILIFIKCKL